MIQFKPTFLYIKQHTITGKLYFGKTTKNDPTCYNGSGTRWKHHIRVHGSKDVMTLWHKLFTDREECMNFALEFSEKMNIVKSDQWLNLIPENGLDGGNPIGNKNALGLIHSKLTRDKISIANKGKKRTVETCRKMSLAKLGKPRTYKITILEYSILAHIRTN